MFTNYKLTKAKVVTTKTFFQTNSMKHFGILPTFENNHKIILQNKQKKVELTLIDITWAVIIVKENQFKDVWGPFLKFKFCLSKITKIRKNIAYKIEKCHVTLLLTTSFLNVIFVDTIPYTPRVSRINGPRLIRNTL